MKQSDKEFFNSIFPEVVSGQLFQSTTYFPVVDSARENTSLFPGFVGDIPAYDYFVFLELDDILHSHRPILVLKVLTRGGDIGCIHVYSDRNTDIRIVK